MANVWGVYKRKHRFRRTNGRAVKRVVIYPKDIMIITGKSERYSRYLIKRIKKHLNKQDHQIVSINEFCSYMGLKIDEVEPLIL
ncbi:MAG: hypothetical protein QNK23_12190 [Crocinitomicaceae bacterium]|nr:hypothetical protein [Crocinitomicaceae bacterium]